MIDRRGSTLRWTDQALLELIRAARKRLVLVTFTAYNIPELRDALIEAARRDVQLTFIAESPDYEGGKNTFSPSGPGHAIARIAEVYLWPLDERPIDDHGRHGALHAKCAIADGEMLFISSANLTDRAFNFNLELGVLVRGGDLPGAALRQLDGLISRSVLKPLDLQRHSGVVVD